MLKEAKIDVKMITGDIRLTAINVGKQLGMISNEEAQEEIIRKSEVLTFSSHLPQKKISQINHEEAKEKSNTPKNDLNNVIHI
jgi:magnesium-transporting ATPase (P-type)